VRTILQTLQVLGPYRSQPVVRAVAGETALIKQLLDIGARTLLVPMVDTAEQAAELVRATLPAVRRARRGQRRGACRNGARAPTTLTWPTTRSACWCRPRP
jgi:2-keto-3-deoxy-L-rhamnonate aldolase RhmA